MPRLLDALEPQHWRRPHIIIALGKGGVGKTTVSIRLGYELSEEGYEALVASMDPAAHMLEYLGLGSPMREKRVAPRLRAVQYTIEAVASRLSAEYASLLQRLMPGITALGSLDFARVVRESPGFEEEVFLRLLAGLYSRSDVDAVVIDMPPTGVALRVIKLPRLYTTWVKVLREIRERIVATKHAIANALGREQPPSDPVLQKLEEMDKKYSSLRSELTDPTRTGAVIVATPEPLPVYEAEQVAKTLEEEKMRLELVVANRVLGEKAALLNRGGEEERLLQRLRSISCKAKPPAGFAAILHASTPVSSLDEVKKLDQYIIEATRRPCQ